MHDMDRCFSLDRLSMSHKTPGAGTKFYTME
jgi:hypothetical protein